MIPRVDPDARATCLALDDVEVLADYVVEDLEARAPLVAGGPLAMPHPLLVELVATLLARQDVRVCKTVRTHLERLTEAARPSSPTRSLHALAWWLRYGRTQNGQRQESGLYRIHLHGWADAVWLDSVSKATWGIDAGKVHTPWRRAQHQHCAVKTPNGWSLRAVFLGAMPLFAKTTQLELRGVGT